MLIPVTIPPGLYKNGTYYDGQNRWVAGNLVRWESGTARPIGGWEKRRDTTGAVLPKVTFDMGGQVRDAFSWADNNNNPIAVWGSNRGVKLLRNSGILFDITPQGYVPGPTDPTTELGYGQGFYGIGLYGVRQSYAGVQPLAVSRWAFSNWGEDLIYSRTDIYSDIYYYRTGTSDRSILPVPEQFKVAYVTPQRFVMCINSVTNPRLVRWSDREDRNAWQPLQTNEAGDITLETKGRLVSIGTVQGQPFILSTSDAFVGIYRGPPYAYGFNKVGVDCGPIHEKAIAYTDNFAVWLGSRSFWLFDGSSVREVPCDLIDFVQTDLSYSNVSKIHTIVSSQFNEIYWFYQSVGSAKVDSYVSYDYVDNYWSAGLLDRTAGVDLNPFVDPVYVDAEGTLYNHELKKSFATGAYLESGPLQIESGERNMCVQWIYPDTPKANDLSYTLLGKQLPTQPNEIEFGPYTQIPGRPIATRASARHLRLRVDAGEDYWELGRTTRFDIAAGGKR